MTDTDTNWFSDETATFGDRLAAARDHAGLSQEELATRLGVETSTLQAWEDDTREPRANRVSMMCGMLGVSLSWLLTGEGVHGPGAPEEDGEIADKDIENLLREIRDTRLKMTRAADKIGRLEKQLRAKLLSAG